MISVHDPALTTFDEVLKTKVVRPEGRAGGAWKGVPHGSLVKQLVLSINAAGLSTQSPTSRGKFVLARDGADFIASIPIDGDARLTGTGIHPHIGLVASNACRRALTFYVGAMIGETPLVVSEYGGLKRFPSWEYIHGLKLEDVCDEAVSIWKTRAHLIETRLERLHDETPEQEEVKQILFDAASKKLTSWSSVGHIWKWWKVNEGSTGFDLVAAFAQCWTCNRPLLRLEALKDFTDSILNERKVLS